MNENSDLASIRWDLVHLDVQNLIAQSAPNRALTMPPDNEEQNHHPQNVPTYLPFKPTRGGMTPEGFGSTARASGSLSGMNAALNYTDTSGYFKRSFQPTPDTSGYFKRSFEPTPRNVQSPLSRSFEAPRQQYDPRPQQRPTMSDGLGPAQSWGLQPRAWESSYQSPYKPAPSADFGLDGNSMSSLHRHPSPPQVASTTVQPQESSVPTELKSVTPLGFYGQNDRTRTDSRSLVENGSGSDALSSSRLQPSLNPGPYSAPRRGRPPKSSSFVIEIPSVTPQKRGSPPKNTEQNPPVHPNSKKRGRPFKTTESAARAAAATSDSTDGISKKRGRPFKVRTQLEIPVPEPEYIPFICEWKGCPAELQNLETLEVHVFNVHSKKQPSGKRFCLWGKCGAKHETDKAVDSQPHDEPNEFRSKAEWKDHVTQQHLVPFAWHMGDGPKGTSLCMFSESSYHCGKEILLLITFAAVKPKSDIARWLMDNNGRQVTPSVKDQPIEGGRAKDNNAKRFTRKVEGIYWVYERIESPKAHMKAQGLRTGNTSDGDDEDDIQMGESP